MELAHRMPVLFVGHGSPMNAIEKTQFGDALAKLGKQLPRPSSILVVSAHWQTPESQILNVERPKTIHDFHGFPEKLFEVRYPAPGAPMLAERVRELFPNIKMSNTWGLDHGTWSVLIHLFPQADIPVLQLSLNESFSAIEHYTFAQGLKILRNEGVMVIGTGNIVHNLRAIKWQGDQAPYPWAVSFDENIKKALIERDFEKVIEFEKFWPHEASLAAPSPEHYWPLLYALAVTDENDELSFPVEGFQLASVSMRAALWKAGNP